jgi:hypothetical protein
MGKMVGVIILSSPLAVPSKTFDLSSDFSGKSNPNQSWQYGYSATNSLAFGLSTTDVHILHNGTSLFDADIDGYGGDPSFHKVEGSSPTAAYYGQANLKAGNTVTFTVGYGKNKTNYGDTTGLIARVVLLAGADSAN